MVGPGTGLAPFRGFLQERQHQRVTENKQVGESHLFYGCRKKAEDYLYRDELEAYVADGTCKLYAAFSREQPHKVSFSRNHLYTNMNLYMITYISIQIYIYFFSLRSKIYVTHLLAERMDLVWNVIGVQSGHFYVCGDARTMARDVHQIVLKTLQEKGGMSPEESEKYFKKMESQRRYCTDVWS